MILRIGIFYGVAITVGVYAIRRGGAPERWVAMLLLAASVATTLIPYDPARTYRTVLLPLLVIDTAFLASMITITLIANRYWPMYFTALHLLSVALHGVRAIDPTVLPVVYARLGGEISYPILLLLMLGTRRHVGRVPEPDWRWQVGREAVRSSSDRR